MTDPLSDRKVIRSFVDRFYAKVRRDEELDPIFSGVIGNHWEAHLERMTDFWSTVMLGTREFQGNVFGKHMALSGVEPEHFRRWLNLFEETVNEMFGERLAEEFLLVARRIAASLQLGFFGEVTVQ